MPVKNVRQRGIKMEIISLSYQAEQQQSTLVEKITFEKSRARKPPLSARRSLSHGLAWLVAEIPAPGWALDVCAMQCHQPSPTLGSLMSDRQQRCDLVAISSPLHILKDPKSAMSPSVPRWSQGRCILPYWLHLHRCLATLKWAPGHTDSPLNFVSFIFFFFWNHLLRGDKNEILFYSWIVVYWGSN